MPMPSHSPIPESELAALKKAGFSIAKGSEKVPRISVATRARTKNGKSHWAIMTTPDPVAVIMLDPGTGEITEKAAAAGRVIIPKFINHSTKAVQEECKKTWQDIRKSINAIIATKSIRTLVIDTISECWELIQLAEFGRIKQNNKFAYGGINAEFSGMIEEIYYSRPDLNTVYIQKVKKQYVDDKWDGKSVEAKGFESLPYLVDLSLMHFFQINNGERIFGFRTDSSEATRFGGQFSGLEFKGEENTFTDLALEIFKGHPQGGDPRYWGLSF